MRRRAQNQNSVTSNSPSDTLATERVYVFSGTNNEQSREYFEFFIFKLRSESIQI